MARKTMSSSSSSLAGVVSGAGGWRWLGVVVVGMLVVGMLVVGMLVGRSPPMVKPAVTASHAPGLTDEV